MAKFLSHKVIISCEHASNSIPDEYAYLFPDARDILNSHRGWDPGSLLIAHAIKNALQAPVFTYPYTRLLIEPNRSEGHPGLFSEFSDVLQPDEKTVLIDDYYKPYRLRVENHIAGLVSGDQPVLHLSVHTFTPILKGKVREMDIGLLYDPSRLHETEFCRQWKQALAETAPHLRVRMNRPYKGTSDGFTTALRRRFSRLYLGIELEVNQVYFTGDKADQLYIIESIKDSLLHIQF